MGGIAQTLYAVWIVYPKGPVLHSTCLTPWRADHVQERMKTLGYPIRIAPYLLSADREQPL